MAKILTIGDLAKQPEIDISEYGLKAEGLAILHQAMEETRADPENRDMELEHRLEWAEEELSVYNDDERKKREIEERIKDLKEWIADPTPRYGINFEVDPAFVVPRSIGIEDTANLKDKYLWLVSRPLKLMGPNYDEPDLNLRIIMARSSDENEMPGKFESHFALYDSSNPEESFKEWLKAAQRVRQSGAGGVVCQVLSAIGKIPSSFIRREYDDMQFKLESGEITDTVKFGLDNCSFVANTGGFLGTNAPSISAVIGLPSKIVRGDLDFNLILHNPYECTVIHNNHDYQDMHFVTDTCFPQDTMDIIDISDPSRIQTVNLIKGTLILACDHNYGLYAMPHDIMSPWGFFTLLKRLVEKTGKHVEIEGTTMGLEEFPHIVQLRKYELPENRLEKLSVIDERDAILAGARSYVADRFSGDLFVIERSDGVDEASLRQKINGRYMLMCPLQSTYSNEWGVDLEHFGDREGMIIPIYDFGGRYAPGAHERGYMLSLVTKLQKKGPVIAIGGRASLKKDLAENLAGRIELHKNFMIFRNVTVESDGENAQIYFNK